jgi:palmitoyltransferase
MHVAAQSNQALLLSYFYDLGVSITVQDLKGGTPLHWAANQGSEICASLLLGWDLSLLNVGDNEGQTALHLAASAGCSKIIKTLLIKGASRSVEDRKGKKPVDIALDKGDEKTARLLKPVSIFTEFGFKAPLRPPRSNYLPVITYLLLYGGGSVLVVGSLSQYISHLPRLGYFAVVVLSFVLFIIVCMKNPGYIESSPVSVARLYEKYESHFICPDCKIYRPARSRHCLCCDRCVEKYDHHCPWVNNCIGGKNLGWFLVFIVATWISLAFKVFICEETIRAENDHPGTISFSLETSKLVAVVIGFTAFLFEVPLSLLVFIQITNFAFNLTTNERFSRHGKVSHGESLVSYEREEKNCFQNCFNMCCNLDEKGRATCEVRPADEDSVIYEEIAKVGDRSISIEPVNKD